MKNIYKLRGAVQHYSWGGTHFIPGLLSIENKDEKPFAEYWLGAHPSASAVVEGENVPLQKFIANDSAQFLGEAVAQRFASLPYLLKILDVKQMLSIQVHPSKQAAEEEYEKENEKGVPLTAPNRNYKDRNHKPELMAALGDFWLLHGFKPEEALTATLTRVKELRFLLPIFEAGGYKALYETVMTLPQEDVDDALRPLMQRIIPAYKNNELQKDDEHFWAARAVLTFCKNKHYDRGIFSVYLFNLLHLKTGEGIYQPAGLPHAYLEGQNVEIMAASDNVLRAGLTDKHVDVPELMKHVRFEATEPKIIPASNNGNQVYDAPVEEFLLTKHTVEEGLSLSPQSATIAFVYDGEGEAVSNGEAVRFKRGEALLLLPGKPVALNASNGRAVLYAATVPV